MRLLSEKHQLGWSMAMPDRKSSEILLQCYGGDYATTVKVRSSLCKHGFSKFPVFQITQKNTKRNQSSSKASRMLVLHG